MLSGWAAMVGVEVGDLLPASDPQTSLLGLKTLDPPELRYPARDRRVFDVFRSDNEASRGAHTFATLAHKLDRPLVRWTGWSLMAYLFQPRALDGRSLEPPIVLRTIGWKSGDLRETVVSAFATGRDWYIIGSNGGLRSDPAWVKNLRRSPSCWVTARRHVVSAAAVELAGEQYAAAWRDLVVRHPVLPTYREKAAQHDRHLSVWRVERRSSRTTPSIATHVTHRSNREDNR